MPTSESSLHPPDFTWASFSRLRLSTVRIIAIAPSATPPQFAWVGAWVTMTPSPVAASTSMSSVPTVHLAMMRSRCAPSMTRRLTGALRIEVPVMAADCAALAAMSSS